MKFLKNFGTFGNFVVKPSILIHCFGNNASFMICSLRSPALNDYGNNNDLLSMSCTFTVVTSTFRFHKTCVAAVRALSTIPTMTIPCVYDT